VSALTFLAKWEVAVYEAVLLQLLWHLGLDVTPPLTSSTCLRWWVPLHPVQRAPLLKRGP
jgi:hypothetical protein